MARAAQLTADARKGEDHGHPLPASPIMVKAGSPAIRSAPPSAHDVARLAGVSQAAVSRAFTPGASISPSMRERVMEAAQTLGYRPNLIARSLITGRSDLIGVVSGNPRNPFYGTAIETLGRRLAAMGKGMLLFTADDGGAADVPVQDLLKYRVDALLLLSATLSSDLAARCGAEGIPVVFFNREARAGDAVASVTGANAEGARAVADHLLDRGYRRLAYLAGTEDTSTNRDREAAFAARLAERGAAPPLRAQGDFRREAAILAVRTLLASADRPDAIFCANDHMAMAAIEVARYEFGIAIGRDLGIAGFDDVGEAAWPSFDLTTYAQPVDAMVDAALTLLDPKEGDGPRNIVVPGELLVRGSTDTG